MYNNMASANFICNCHNIQILNLQTLSSTFFELETCYLIVLFFGIIINFQISGFKKNLQLRPQK